MRAISGYLIFAGLAVALSGCSAPYYVARPAPVYNPLHAPGINSPTQHASINDSGPRTEASPGREGTRSAEARRARHRTGEQRQATQQGERHWRAGNNRGWVDPQP
jgi:hypothetical protein